MLKIAAVAVIAVLAVPLLYFGGLLTWFAVVNFPFTSSVVAHVPAPTGEEICVVQTFKGGEPYQVSLYARRAGEAWAWNYLAHQDTRWRACRVEFAEDTIRVYRGQALVRELPLSRATDVTVYPTDALSPQYSPQQLLAHHDSYFRR